MQIFVENCLSCMRRVFKMLVLAKDFPTCVGEALSMAYLPWRAYIPLLPNTLMFQPEGPGHAQQWEHAGGVRRHA